MPGDSSFRRGRRREAKKPPADTDLSLVRVRARIRAQCGFTLIEVAMASLVLIVGMLGVLTMVDLANHRTVETKGREAATGLARQLVEDVRAVPYEQLTDTSIESELQARPGLASVGGSPIYTIRRRGFTYSVNANVCTLDDPRDGIGAHTGGDFCKGGAGIKDGPDCQAAVAAQGSGGLDVNGNRLDASVCATVEGSLVWNTCNLLNTSASAQASGSLAAILGPLYADAQAAAAATVCNTGAATAADADPEDYKRVTINVRWRGKRTQQTALVANPSSAFGPNVTNLVLAGGTTVTSGDSAAFTATTSRPPSTVNWTLDGDQRGTASGSGTTWTFNWALGDPSLQTSALDGSYIVGARALDAYGLSGVGRTLTVTLNRRVPFAPTDLAGGRNGSVLEFEWAPNPERDIVGYRVFRVNGSGADTQVCPAVAGSTQVAVTCQDTIPPGVPEINYYVVAYDRDTAGALRAGDPSTQVTVTQGNTRPNPPTNLLASTSNGTTILVWQAPVPADPDAGDQIAFYRIYRDGSSYADRYDRTNGTEVNYTDTHTDGVQHTYWITAVDEHYAESVLLGPITK
jgi:hypothetical protein